MVRTIAIGEHDFVKIRENNYFYVDKTDFIKEWWNRPASTTLISRPCGYGKTLNVSMLEAFFSMEFAGRSDLFEGLTIWKDEECRALQGKFPVISISFADVKGTTYKAAREKICNAIIDLYVKYDFLLESDAVWDSDKKYFAFTRENMDDISITSALHRLSNMLFYHYGKKVIVILDSYDTPMQEAYANGYWDEMFNLLRNFLVSAFKANTHLERGIIIGVIDATYDPITEYLNNLNITTTDNRYETAFGFTEDEVFAALDESGYSDRKAEVKEWYNGLTFGEYSNMYNPSSIVNFLDSGELGVYCGNTDISNFVGKLIREGNIELKRTFENVTKGDCIRCSINESICFKQLNCNEDDISSLMVAAGYLKVLNKESKIAGEPRVYTLKVANKEVYNMFRGMIKDWFSVTNRDYDDFVKALLCGDLEKMNECIKQVVNETYSYFDTSADSKHPEKFYLGLIMRLLVDLEDDYVITPNHESGHGRYDVIIEPKDKNKDAIILEFKVRNAEDEPLLESTVRSSLKQIEEKQYKDTLVKRGFSPDRIRKYGFAFEGKSFLIGTSTMKESNLQKLNAF